MIVFVARDERPLGGLAGLVDWRTAGRLSAILRDRFFEGELGERLLTPLGANIAASRLLALGIGASSPLSSGGEVPRDPVALGRELGLAAAVCALGLRARTVLVGLPVRPAQRPVAEGILLGWTATMRELADGIDVLRREAETAGSTAGPESSGGTPGQVVLPGSTERSLDLRGETMIDAASEPHFQQSREDRSKSAGRKGKKKDKERTSKRAPSSKVDATQPSLEVSNSESQPQLTVNVAEPISGAGAPDSRRDGDTQGQGSGTRWSVHVGTIEPLVEANGLSEDPSSSGAFVATRLQVSAEAVSWRRASAPHLPSTRSDTSSLPQLAASNAALPGVGDSRSSAVNAGFLGANESQPTGGTSAVTVSGTPAPSASSSSGLRELGSEAPPSAPEPPIAVFAADPGHIARLRRVLAGPPRPANVTA